MRKEEEMSPEPTTTTSSADALTSRLTRTVLQQSPSSIPGREIVQVLTEIPPGVESGWHVHPGHDTYVFQTQGRLRLEFGPGGTESVEGGPGDFVLIPKGVVHREGNPGTEPNEAIVVRVGEGEVLVNVDGP